MAEKELKEKLEKVPKRRAGFYYLKEVDNKPLVSVTTVLEIISAPGMIYWAAKRMFTTLAENPEKLGDMESAISDAIYKPRNDAGERGGKAHEIIDNEERGMIYDRKTLDSQVVGYLKARDRFLADHPQLETAFSEAIGFNKTLEYAGQIDRIVRDKNTNELWIIDWKTGNVYPEAGLQMVAYKNFEMLEDRRRNCFVEMPKITRLIAVRLKDNGTYQTIDFSNELFDNFLAALTLWRWRDDLQNKNR